MRGASLAGVVDGDPPGTQLKAAVGEEAGPGSSIAAAAGAVPVVLDRVNVGARCHGTARCRPDSGHIRARRPFGGGSLCDCCDVSVLA